MSFLKIKSEKIFFYFKRVCYLQREIDKNMIGVVCPVCFVLGEGVADSGTNEKNVLHNFACLNRVPGFIPVGLFLCNEVGGKIGKKDGLVSK